MKHSKICSLVPKVSAWSWYLLSI